jgi:hypothetical protein
MAFHLFFNFTFPHLPRLTHVAASKVTLCLIILNKKGSRQNVTGTDTVFKHMNTGVVTALVSDHQPVNLNFPESKLNIPLTRLLPDLHEA